LPVFPLPVVLEALFGLLGLPEPELMGMVVPVLVETLAPELVAGLVPPA
jgi:hypothetical protein